MDLCKVEDYTNTLLQRVKPETLFEEYFEAIKSLIIEYRVLKEKDEQWRQKSSKAGKISRAALTQEERTRIARMGGLARAKQKAERGF